jgi:NADH:ubiquinone oxidoreductase subunit K
MVRLIDRLPWYAWVATSTLAAIACAVFFVPPSVGAALGLTLEQFILAMGAIELSSAIGIGAIVVHYRTTDYEEPEYRFNP